MERQFTFLTNKNDLSSAPQRRPKPKPAASPEYPLDRLQHSIGNRGLGRWIQTKLEVGPPNDAFEQEADRIADQVVGSSVPVPSAHAGAPAVPQRACGGSGDHGCEQCSAERTMQMKRDGSAAVLDAASTSPRSFAGGGEPLPAQVRIFYESRFHHNFSAVRVHEGPGAAVSARLLGARAYTLGQDIVFGSGEYAPASEQGAKLLAHELAHVVQQGAGQPLGSGPSASIGGARVQRQFITPLAPGGGFGGLMERDRQAALPPPAGSAPITPIQVCSRPLQAPGLGIFFDHAFIKSPPSQYAVITPPCDPTDGGWNNPVLGTVAQKWDDSRDPCGKSPVECVPCLPKPGVADVEQCLRDAFTSYNHPSLYKALGPNSNTFAGTLARACCDKMVPKPAGLGTVPGWDDPPSPARAGKCPPGPSCT